jgi:succinate-semialdehyde dehydrogenase/glutarate-semialdehyde dehydrogenase
MSRDGGLRDSIIGGRDVPGNGGSRPVIDPASGESFAEVSLLDREQALSALSAAETAFPAWSRLSFSERGRYLLKVRELLLASDEEVALLIGRSQGKPVAEAQLAELFPSLEALKHLAQHAEDVLRPDPAQSEMLLLAHKRSRIEYVPLGVILVITPWNYPLSISLIGVATALAAGNTVVLKPAPATTVLGLKVGELFRAAGVPPGVVNVVSVDDAIADALVRSPRVAKIVFTGSVPTGRKIMTAAAENLTPVVLELGGKDPAIVCRDADLGRAAQGIVWGAFMNAGQTCASVERVYVERSVAAPFIEKVVALARALEVGPPTSPKSDVGPMTLERQRAVVEEHVRDAREKGATVLLGGSRPEGPGYFYPPTVLTKVTHEMKVMTEETFGPLLPIMEVANLDEALSLANASPYGLTASGWTRSAETAKALEAGLSAGSVTINDCVSSFSEPGAPWGGVRQSGIGRTHGAVGLREMAQVKYLSADWQKKPLLWWYPYGPDLRRVARAANRAIHASAFFGRVANQLALARSSRFWARVSPLSLLKNIDRLF